MYIARIIFTVFLLGAFFMPLKAELWIRDDYTFGAGNLNYNRLAVSFPVRDMFAMGVEAALYSDKATEGIIYSARLPFYITTESFYLTLRPFFYPAIGQNDAWAAGMYALGSFALFETGDGMSGQLNLSVAGSVQHSDFYYPDRATTKSLGAAAYQLTYRHNMDNMFLFSATGALFQYFDSVSDSFSTLLAMDNAEMVSWNFISAYRKLPQLVGGIEISRTTDEAAHASMFFSYYYLKHMQDYAHVNSLAAGFKMDLFDNTVWFVTYNIQFAGQSKSEYYKIGLRMGFQ